MICAFCRQDVRTPCHTVQEMQQRAADHIDRCENALRRRGGGSHPERAPSTDMGSSGKA